MAFNTYPCNPWPISTEELNKGNNDDLNTRVSTLEGEVSDLNSAKANQITIAPFFSAEASYSVGDLVYYNGLTYRCTNDHEGEWDADDFASTTISNELDTLKSGLSDLIRIRTIDVTPDNIGINYLYVDRPDSSMYTALFLQCVSSNNADQRMEMWVQVVNAADNKSLIRYKATLADITYNIILMWIKDI